MSESSGICKIAYGVGYLPGRKQVKLYRTCGSLTSAVASFDNEDDALEFLMFMDRLIRPFSNEPPLEEWHGWALVEK